MRFTDDGIEMTATEAKVITRRLSVVAVASLTAILVGVALYLTAWRTVGGDVMLFALIPTVCTVVPLFLLRLARYV